MKKVIFVILFLIFSIYSVSYAVSDNEFTLSIVHDGYPVREIDKRVAIPFDTEYLIRLKNEHDRKCTAKVFIDGTPVSKLGDFILGAKAEIDLERFLDSSLTEGKRFKFVRLSHPDVDDPNREENGIVRVEFRLEEEPKVYIQSGNIIIRYPDSARWLELDNKSNIRFMDGEATYTNDTSVLCSNTSSTEPGATIAGSESNQTFYWSHMDVEDQVYALELRMVGITEISQLPW